MDTILKNWKCVSYFYQGQNGDTCFPDDHESFHVGSLLSARSSHGTLSLATCVKISSVAVQDLRALVCLSECIKGH